MSLTHEPDPPVAECSDGIHARVWRGFRWHCLDCDARGSVEPDDILETDYED